MVTRRIRFSQENECIVNISDGERGCQGLLRDESFNGCCAIFYKNFPFSTGDTAEIRMGDQGKYKCEIAWVKEFDEVLIKAGINIKV